MPEYEYTLMCNGTIWIAHGNFDNFPSYLYIFPFMVTSFFIWDYLIIFFRPLQYFVGIATNLCF